MIHIACNIDDNYIMQCCTTLVSVMYNNRNEQITFHMIAEKLSNKAKSMLTEEEGKYNQQIHFYAYNLNMNLSYRLQPTCVFSWQIFFLQRYIRYYIWTAISS